MCLPDVVLFRIQWQNFGGAPNKRLKLAARVD